MAKAPMPAGELVRLALLNVANAAGEVKLSGKGGVFASATGGNKNAIEELLNPDKPLLAVVRTDAKAQFVALTPAGFERIATEVSEDKAATLAKAVAAPLKAGARAEFLQNVIRRTPLAATELVPLLEEAVAAEKAESAARVAAAAKRRATEEAATAALDRAKELIEERRRNRLEALKREWEAEGENASELPVSAKKHARAEEEAQPARKPGPQPKTDEEKDFRRDVAKQLAETWRAAWNDKKDEGRDYLESAMWNVSGIKMIGEPDARLAFNGRYHECATAAFTGDAVKVARPGWLVEEGATDFVAIKAVVEKL